MAKVYSTEKRRQETKQRSHYGVLGTSTKFKLNQKRYISFFITARNVIPVLKFYNENIQQARGSVRRRLKSGTRKRLSYFHGYAQSVQKIPGGYLNLIPRSRPSVSFSVHYS
jgi:hypothetical protein